MNPRASILIGLLAAAGCAVDPLQISPADLEAPTADYSGGWIHSSGCFLLNLRQRGNQVTGTAHDLTIAAVESISDFFAGDKLRDPVQEVEGEVTGRVLRGTLRGPEGHTMCLRKSAIGIEIDLTSFAMMISPDGRSARFCDPYREAAVEEFVRPIRMPSAIHPRAARDPLLAGGLICLLPVGPDGRVMGIVGEEHGLREVLVVLQYERDSKETIQSILLAVPLEAPRTVSVLDPLRDSYVVSSLGQARARSPLHGKHAFALEGKPHGWILNPVWKPGGGELEPAAVDAEIYREDPAGGAMPVDLVTVAHRTSQGEWSPAAEYLSLGQMPTVARAVLENGRPTGVEIREVEAPPLEDFMIAKEVLPRGARLRNKLLVVAKNRTVPTLLRESKSAELKGWVDRIEQLILELNREIEAAKGQAQRVVEKGEGDPTEWREWATLYQERIELFKPILAAIKEEIANREK